MGLLPGWQRNEKDDAECKFYKWRVFALKLGQFLKEYEGAQINGYGYHLNMGDFSIDYILNRAGEKYLGTNCCVGLADRINQNASPEQCETLRVRGALQNQLDECNQRFQMFDWLQYTRYHPPKLPRPLRQGPIKRTPGRLPRVPFTPAQLQALENAYSISTYLSSEDANNLAMKLDLTNTRVKIWFQNRRARERREKRERNVCSGVDNRCDSTMSSTSSSPEPEMTRFSV